MLPKKGNLTNKVMALAINHAVGNHRLRSLQSRYLVNLLATLNSYRLTAQMDERFVLVQTLNLTLPSLLQRLSDDMFYVWVHVSTQPVKSIPLRVCHTPPL